MSKWIEKTDLKQTAELTKPVPEKPASAAGEIMLHWIEVEGTRHVLPIGGASGYVHLNAIADLPIGKLWNVEHTCLAGREVLARDLTLPQAMRFAEAYVMAATHSVSLTAKEAGWRDDPMSDLQRGRLLLLLGVAELPDMTAGEASDLFQKTKAQRLLVRESPEFGA